MLPVEKNIKQYPLARLQNRATQLVEFEILPIRKIGALMDDLNPSDIPVYHTHAFYTIVWVDKGTCTQSVDKRTYLLEKNTAFIISPGQVHENAFEKSQDFSGGAVLFSPEFLLPLIQRENPVALTFLNNLYITPKLHLSASEFAGFRKTIRLMVSEKGYKKPTLEIMQSLLSVLLLQMQRNVDTGLENHLSGRHVLAYKKFISLLERNFSVHSDLDYYANALGITSRHLGRLLKEASGKTIGGLILARKLLEAKRLLSLSELTVNQIAWELGYPDDSYFNKVFKKETGMTPKSFREEMSR